MMRGALALVALLSACDGSSGEALVLELRTDYVPGAEFVEVETRLVDEGQFVTAAVLEDDDFLAGRRVAEFRDLAPGSYEVTMSLLAPDGSPLVGRRVRVAHDAASSVTVVVTRSCEAVGCGADQSCFAGECVEASCVSGGEASCPMPECVGDGDCPAPTAVCARASCVSGACLTTAESGACATGERCDLAFGCVPVAAMGCGDGEAAPSEGCDDGNLAPGDGCDPSCELEDQGNGGDACSEARPLTFVPTPGGRLTAFATGDTESGSDSVDTCAAGAGRDRIYSFTLDVDATVFVGVEASLAADIVLGLRGGAGVPCVDPSGEIRCVDGAGVGGTESLMIDARAGRYYVVVDSTEPDVGTFALTVTATP